VVQAGVVVAVDTCRVHVCTVTGSAPFTHIRPEILEAGMNQWANASLLEAEDNPTPSPSS